MPPFQRHTLGILLAIGLNAAAGTVWPVLAWAAEPGRGTYLGIGTIDNTSCKKEREFVYIEPPGQGPAPIAVYLPGTIGEHDGPIPLMYLQRLSEKGFVAVSVDYGQFALLCSFGCSCYKPRSDCLFDPDGSRSLVSVIARTTRGDPTKGIVVWGHSQGGYMALMSGDLNPHILRALATGTTECAGRYDCITPKERGLPSDRIRVIIGENDETAPPRQPEDRGKTPGFKRQLAGVTEQPERCAGPKNYSCFRPNGSGFYIVRGDETEKGVGDHRYFQKRLGDKDVGSLDGAYVKPGRPWGLDAIIDWLSGACGNGVCDATEDIRTCALDCGASGRGAGTTVP